MTASLEQVLASVVLMVVLARLTWLLARPTHHDEAYWGRTHLRVESWLTRHARIRV